MHLNIRNLNIKYMKTKYALVWFVTFLLLFSCQDKEDGIYEDYLVAKPLTITTEEFNAGVDIIAPLPIEESGKIYAYENYVFINDKYKGVHVIDNSNPASPEKIAFIKIAGNVDISVKNNYLYADSIADLMVLDISDIYNIRIVDRLKNVLGSNIVWPVDVDFFDYGEIDYENEIIVGWETVTEKMLVEEYEERYRNTDVLFAETTNDASTGQGGSLARFKIVDNYLYAVDSHFINIFNIEDLSSPKDLEDVFAGFDIETIFNRDNYLFLGSMRGMYIYDITEPETPTFVSEFQHGTACDPVVVDGDYAYVTLRGGNACGALESGLFIVDISEITNPVLAESYPLESPYGLGVKDEKLFICDGPAGLKVYDKTNIKDLKQLNHFQDISTFDVIPLEEQLLMVGDEVLYQYQYLNNNLKLLSTLELN